MDELNEIIEQLELAKRDLNDYLDTLDEDYFLDSESACWWVDEQDD